MSGIRVYLALAWQGLHTSLHTPWMHGVSAADSVHTQGLVTASQTLPHILAVVECTAK